ncbi:hypothetical protein RJ640_015512 [Escallonia rubra]|uniref:Glutamate receptor n=1 Tax=Escallonia rubra TaxID=112253 RepID=A0AA88RVW4_9ASTE|nr:hypothetical protein RJ640_015512 [Escallonia rubra]
MMLPKMPFLVMVSTFLLISLALEHVTPIDAAQSETINVGAIVNADTRIGREAKVGMQIAAQYYNRSSSYHKVSLHFHEQNWRSTPLQAAYAADELIRQRGVQAIIGMETWEEATLVSEVGRQAKVPVISFTSSAVTLPLVPPQSSYLVQLSSNVTEQIKCVAAIVGSFNWRWVIPIYEVDNYGGDSGTFAALAEALRDAGAEIEFRLALPPFSSLSNPQSYVRDEVTKLLNKQSRVFIVLHSSFSMATHLFKEAKEIGLMGKDSAWITTDEIASLLESVNTSVISSMEGALGIKTYFLEGSMPFNEFKRQFRLKFLAEYPEEDFSEMGIYALRAYDSIVALTNAIEKLGGANTTSLLEAILSVNFKGLSGDILFSGRSSLQSSEFRIVNVIGKRYKELGFWSSKFGFSKGLIRENGGEKIRKDSMEVLSGLVNWPGDLKRVPKGWSMPTNARPMKIGVPARTSFEKFVKVAGNGSSKDDYDGFCIKVFKEVLKQLEKNYSLPYDFVPYNGTYDDLVNHVANKSYDAVIGDVTILADRSKRVDFTQSFADSSLTMIVTLKPQPEKAWMFLKPFTLKMWVLTAVMLMYTVMIVWLLEGRSNPEFEGPWLSQLGTAFWFTSTTLFFAHREKVHNNYARVVVLAWLFVVLALNSSYTASLSSMLTVQQLEPNVTDVERLKKTNAKVGCDGDSFVRRYLEDVHKFKSENIRNVSTEYEYPEEFVSGNITAAFLELPYQKAFFNHYCKGYTVSGITGRYGEDRFGGLGFVFQKGSPLTADFSQVILSLLESGWLKDLETVSFAPSSKCLTSQAPDKSTSLSWRSFWGLYLCSAITSTLCYLAFFIRQSYERLHEAYNNMWYRLTTLVLHFHR